MENLTKHITWRNVQGTREEIKKYVNYFFKDHDVYVANLVIVGTTVSFTTYSKVSYEDLVARLIRKHYPLNEEFAILRKAILNPSQEYYDYNAYVEECKIQAKAFIDERNKVLEV